jgi:hypothetical protein
VQRPNTKRRAFSQINGSLILLLSGGLGYKNHLLKHNALLYGNFHQYKLFLIIERQNLLIVNIT